MLSQMAQGVFHFAILDVSVAVDKKEVLPGFSLAGTRFDFGHINAVTAEGGQSAVQRADFVGNTDHNAGAVAAGWGTALAPQHQEARGVGRVVLDIVIENIQALLFSRENSR